VEDDANDRGVRLKSLPRNILQDQQAFFTTPFHMSERQWKILVPLTILGVGLVASDTAIEAHVTKSASTVSTASNFSNAGLAAMAGVGGGMYLWGVFAKNEHQRETGFLSGEAALDAYLDTTVIKYVAGRDRPFTANGRGKFFDGGSSFPSLHSSVSWAIASVIAHEYPGPMTKVLSYGLAGAVSVARVEAHQHFAGDAVIGSALGWYIGRQVYRARSADADIDVRKWGKFERDAESEEARETSQMGSSYVALDSWVYDALDRLTGMRYVRSGSTSVRPWTRLECARMLQEAHESGEEDPVAEPLLSALDAEFAHETSLMDGGKNTAAEVESVYARFTGISGTPLRDSFHFAQTLVDDNGRPYGQGVNAIAGFSSHAESGPLALYVRGEYQYASAIPVYNAAAQQAVADFDGLPYGWDQRLGTTSRARPVEAYAVLNMSDWQFSFGQQTQWWGPDRSTSMILSNNAEAMPMVRLDRVRPLRIPWLGQIQGNIFIARQGGVHYLRLGPSFILTGSPSRPMDPPPYVWGVSFSIKPTENLELGLTHTTIFAGFGRPLNLKTFVHTFSPTGNNQAVDPGKRTTEFNFSYHIPGLRKWLVLYTETYAYDSPTDRISFERYALAPGIYLPQLPGLRKLDFRIEGVNTNLPGLKSTAYFYSNEHYAQGYTNYGQIFGSWVGRQGTGGQATSTYWFSARNKATVSYRRTTADKAFLQGGKLEDFTGSLTWMIRPGFEFSASSQYESWKFPLLAIGAKSDVATSFGVRFFPGMRYGSN
jgi:membrane-associated phospholipid phosphatase